VAAFVPTAPPGSKVGAIQMNDVYVASDGIVYAADRSGGGFTYSSSRASPESQASGNRAILDGSEVRPALGGPVRYES
jgi:hypothetical protein